MRSFMITSNGRGIFIKQKFTESMIIKCYRGNIVLQFVYRICQSYEKRTKKENDFEYPQTTG